MPKVDKKFKYGTVFNPTVCFLGQMVMKKGPSMQSVYVAKAGSHLVRPKVVAFTGKVECKKYPKAVLNFITKEQQMQVRKLGQEQGIKPAIMGTSAEARVIALEAKFGVSSEPKQVKTEENLGETLNGLVLGRNRRNSAVTCQALDAKCKDLSWLIWSLKGDIKISCLDKVAAICTSVQTVHLSAHNSLAIV